MIYLSQAESPIGQSLNLDVSYTKSPTDDNSIEADESGAFTDTDHNGKVIGNRTVQAENDNPQTIILSSTDSSPEKSTNSSLSDPGMTTATIKNDEAGFAMDASDSIQSQTSHFDNNPSTKVEETVVRKRGRPRLSKNKKPSLNLPRSKRGKRAEIDESPVQEKPLKLIINIKDSKITESPTRAFAELEDNSLDERLQNNEDEDMDEKEAEEQKPSTPQKALSGFKIPKRQRPSTEENDSVKNENQNRSSKVRFILFWIKVYDCTINVRVNQIVRKMHQILTLIRLLISILYSGERREYFHCEIFSSPFTFSELCSTKQSLFTIKI